MTIQVEYKIISAIEKLGQLFRTLLWDIAKKEHLSPLQIQLLIFLYNHSDKLCRVSNISCEFGITSATVSDAVSSLEEKRLVFKSVLQNDHRVTTLRLTAKGKRLIRKLTHWANTFIEHLEQFSPEVKETVMVFLMELIGSLQKSGIISIARMCIGCGNFQKNFYPKSKKPHYCQLTQKPIANLELKMDCQYYRSLFFPAPIISRN